MIEIKNIIDRYSNQYINSNMSDLESLNQFSFIFYSDAAEIYDCITRLKNTHRNKSGYSLSDAPIIGLLVKTWKLFKEIVSYHGKDNAEMISYFERPLLEAAITAQYLMISDDSVIEDYRKLSYKDRLRILDEVKKDHPFYNTNPGQRILKSVNEKMNLEKLTPDSFKLQKSQRWKLQGKSFKEIFSMIEPEESYKYTYGMMSESMHASWNDSMDWCLQRNEDGTFDINPFHHQADIRYMVGLLITCNKTFYAWLKRIEVDEPYIFEVLILMEKINYKIYHHFDSMYEE